MVSQEVRTEVQRRLRQVEEEHQVTVLYAVESGSRAWGFASPNSDYDVRFVYAHPKEWYLSIDEKRDVIEYPIIDDYDLNGWDIRKALRLFQKSNPSLLEWLHSPIVYRCDSVFSPTLREMVTDAFSSVRSVYHYLSMAKTNYRGYLREPTVPLKKYFYVLRPILAANWVEQYHSMPPILFSELVASIQTPTDVEQQIQMLLERKIQSTEKSEIPVNQILNDYIESELERFQSFFAEHQARYPTPQLDTLFREVLA